LDKKLFYFCPIHLLAIGYVLRAILPGAACPIVAVKLTRITWDLLNAARTVALNRILINAIATLGCAFGAKKKQRNCRSENVHEQA
jgi:hypothetical protein